MIKQILYALAILPLSFMEASIAAPPSAPTGLCIESIDGVECSTSSNSGSSGSSTSGANNITNLVAPKSVNPSDFHPGFYLSVGQSNDSPSAAFGVLTTLPEFVGGKRIYRWRDLEPTEGNYNFSQIEQDLTYLKSIGKRLWIQVFYTQFNGAQPPLTPSYMWKDSVYGCGPDYYGTYARSAAAGGWIPCLWNSNVNNKLQSLYSALGNRFNGEEYFEGISLDETAIDTNAAKTNAGYNATAVNAAFKANSLAARKAFPDKIVMQHINYAPYNLVEFSSWLAQNEIGIGSPDVILHNNTLTGTIYPQYSIYHNTVPTGPDVQWSNYEQYNAETGRNYTAEEILTGMVSISNPWYMFWIKRSPYFNDDVIPTIRKYGNLPAAKEFYESMNSIE